MNEGQHKIAVIFKLLDSKALSRDSLIRQLDNYVFLIFKKCKNERFKLSTQELKKSDTKLLNDSEQSSEMNKSEYWNYVYKYIWSKDQEFNKYLLPMDDIVLSTEVIESIQKSIYGDREKLKEQWRTSAPRKKFQGIDMELRHAIVSPNITSMYWEIPEGVVKHAELKIGNLVPSPMLQSTIDFLKDNYTEEEWEQVNWFEGVSTLCARQASIFVNGKVDRLCRFNPMELLSKNKDVRRTALFELFTNGGENAKIYQEGTEWEISDVDLDFLENVIAQGVLDARVKYESLNDNGFDEVAEMYDEVIAEDPHPSESMLKYFQNFFDVNLEDLEEDSIEYKWKWIMDLIVAESIKGSSIMIRWEQKLDGNNNVIQKLKEWKLIDLDTKKWTELKKKCKTYHK